MNSAGVPPSTARCVTAAARCVFPHPLGPANTSQPDGASAKARAASRAEWNSRRSSGSALTPSSFSVSNVNRASTPRLLYRSSRSRRSCAPSCSQHEHGSMEPQRGWPKGTSTRTHRVPLHSGQTGSVSSSGLSTGSPDDLAGANRASTSPSRSISSAIVPPPPQHRLDVGAGFRACCCTTACPNASPIHSGGYSSSMSFNRSAAIGVMTPMFSSYSRNTSGREPCGCLARHRSP